MTSRLISMSVGTRDTEDYVRTFQDISELAKNLAETHGYINVTATVVDADVDEDDKELVHTEHTLFRVRQAIKNATPFLDEQGVTDIISEMQNAGILFRERR